VAADEIIEYLIKVDKDTGAVKNVTDEIQKLDKQVGKLPNKFKAVGRSISDVDKKTKGLGDNTKGLQGKTKQAFSFLKAQWIGIAAGIASAIAAVKAFGSAMDLADLASKAEDISFAFNKFSEAAGQSAKILLGELRQAAKGTISDINLMEKANAAFLLGGKELFAELPKLIEIARGAALATGQSVEFLFDSIVLGVGRQSRQILDNVGIILSAEKANQQYADALGIEASQLTDVQKKQAFLNGTLEAGQLSLDALGGSVTLQTDRLAKMKAISEEVDRVWGERLKPTVDALRDSWTNFKLTLLPDDIRRNMLSIEELNTRIFEEKIRIDELTEANEEAGRGQRRAIGQRGIEISQREANIVVMQKEIEERARLTEAAEKQRQKNQEQQDAADEILAKENERLAIRESNAAKEQARLEATFTDRQKIEKLTTQLLEAEGNQRLAIARRIVSLEKKIDDARRAGKVKLAKTLLAIELAAAQTIIKLAFETGAGQKTTARDVAREVVKTVGNAAASQILAHAATGASKEIATKGLAGLPSAALVLAKGALLAAGVAAITGAAVRNIGFSGGGGGEEAPVPTIETPEFGAFDAGPSSDEIANAPPGSEPASGQTVLISISGAEILVAEEVARQVRESIARLAAT